MAKLTLKALQNYPKKQAPFPDLLAQDFNPLEWANRPDGTKKGMGFLGLLKRPDGGISSEISASFGPDVARGQDIPLLVPTLTRAEVEALLANNAEGQDFFNTVPPSIFAKAIDFARRREARGLPYFAEPYEYPVQKKAK